MLRSNVTRFKLGGLGDAPFLFMPGTAEYVAFYVTIKNNSSSIIKMKDIRINYNVAGDSFLALQKNNMLESLGEKTENEIAVQKKALVHNYNKVAGIYLGEVVMAKNKRFKLINNFDAEIQPSQLIKGFVFFDANIAGVKLAEDYSVTLPPTASLDFNAIPIAFDAVGNPTSRENASLKLVKIQKSTKE